MKQKKDSGIEEDEEHGVGNEEMDAEYGTIDEEALMQELEAMG